MFDFQQVKEGKSVTSRPVIDFRLSDYAYRMILDNKNDVYIPYKIMHMDNNNKRCPYCQRYSLLHPHCSHLERVLYPLFLQLIEQPSIRLHWVYRQYQPKDETF